MLAVFGIGGLEILFLLILLPLGLACMAFWIWMLVSAIQNKGLSDGEKVAWVIAIALVHMLGALLYFFIGHPKRKTPLTV
jgi:hypothetical protein